MLKEGRRHPAPFSPRMGAGGSIGQRPSLSRHRCKRQTATSTLRGHGRVKMVKIKPRIRRRSIRNLRTRRMIFGWAIPCPTQPNGVARTRVGSFLSSSASPGWFACASTVSRKGTRESCMNSRTGQASCAAVTTTSTSHFCISASWMAFTTWTMGFVVNRALRVRTHLTGVSEVLCRRPPRLTEARWCRIIRPTALRGDSVSRKVWTH
mmetsp:Transcript_21131/g.60365  ORF Transcript_21131/g.60365 Transcript_21131/m.60365 type:complete len:208 (+) Transcript_21131:448-1071(+)